MKGHTRRFRYLKTKGVLFVLAWNSVFYSTVLLSPHVKTFLFHQLVPTVQLSLYILPAVVADLYLGRHRALLWGTLATWVALVAVSMITALSGSGTITQQQHLIPVYCATLVSAGRILFQSNVVQYGADQLPEGSSDEFSSFVHWFVFTEMFGETTGFILSHFVPLPWSSLVLTAVFSLLLVLLHCCSDSCFSKEPPNKSAYSIIYQVLKYAWKHKFPERRAFMYWDEKPLSRMDLGKGCNGGPFTCEQVEDVKVFLRLVGKIVIFLGILFSQLYHFFYIETYQVLYVHLGLADSSILSKLSAAKQVKAAVCFIYVAFHEFVAIPLFRRCVPSILKRLWVSLLLLFLSTISSLAIDIVGHAITPNKTATCFLNLNTTSSSDALTGLAGPTPYVILVPHVLSSLGFVIAYISSLEFVLAQAPLAFRGLCIGVFFSVLGGGYLFSALTVLFPIHFKYQHSTTSQVSCGTAYLLMITLIGAAGLAFFTMVAFKYKYRERGGSLNQSGT